MAAVTLKEMRAAESTAKAEGWTEEQLLDLAGERLGRALGRFFPQPGTVIGYLGKGHNAGDALVAMRVLRDSFGWQVAARLAYPLNDCAPLTRHKWQALGLAAPLDHAPSWRDMEGSLMLLDGLLGSGSSGALREPLRSIAAEMEWLRQHAGARVAAVDLPSGIDADCGELCPGGVTADLTLMIGNAKRGLLAGHAANTTGALSLVPVEALTVNGLSDLELIAPQSMAFAKSPRPFDFHKGQAGRIAVLAGSTQYSGAAVLAAIGALRGGGGLVTLHVPHPVVALISAKCPPEIIVRGYTSPAELLPLNADALVIGCGLGELDAPSATELLNLIAQIPVPAVIDADALNLIARSGMTGILSHRHVITPHPGEFQRLAPDLGGLSREAAARAFADRVPATLLLKGCRTLVTCRGQPLWCNATGNPAMATGGQGDLLAGVIGARLAIHDPPLEAAALAAWICGRAAEIALEAGRHSAESLTPLDLAPHLGHAFLDWQCSRR